MCLAEFYNSDLIHKGLKACPNCGTVIPPQKISEDGFVKVNWQELRVLATYAKRWASTFSNLPTDQDMIKALDNTIMNLARYTPHGGLPIIQPDQFMQKPPEKTIPQVAQQEEKQPDGRIKSPFYQPKGPGPLQEQ